MARFTVDAVFKAVDRVTAPISKIQNRVQRFTRVTEVGFRKVNHQVDGFNRKINGTARRVAGLATAGALAAGVLLGAGLDFEQTLTAAAAKFPGIIREGMQEFTLLQEAARDIGRTTEFTATQGAEAIKFLAMAGFSAEKALAALPGVVDLATVAALDLGRATDIATDTLGAFGLAVDDPIQLAKNLARVNDVLAKTANSANADVEQLFETIVKGAPLATQAGVSIETFAALAGTMANSGIKASVAGTTLKNTFLALTSAGGESAKVLQKLGADAVDSGGNLDDVVDIFARLDKGMANLGSAERARVLNAIFGRIPIAGVSTLLAAGTQSIQEFREELEKAGGTNKEIAGIMRGTTLGSLNALKSAIESVKISLFLLQKGPLKDTIDRTTEWVRANEELIAGRLGAFLLKIIDNFENIVKWTKRIGIGLAVWWSFVAVLKTLTAVVTLLNVVAMANPYVQMVVWIMLVVGAVTLLIKKFGGLKGMWEGTKGFFSKLNPFNDDEDEADATSSAAPRPQVNSPQERTARMIEERNTTERAEVVIRDDTGRAEMSGAPIRGLRLSPSGGL